MRVIHAAAGHDPRLMSELSKGWAPPGPGAHGAHDLVAAFENVGDARRKRHVPAAAPDAAAPTPVAKAVWRDEDPDVECVDVEMPENEPATLVQLTA